jgi:AcrR family transcriptional regulator
MSPTARRQAIVEAALAVAIRKGFGTTTVRDVANELGCSSGLIHHYFDSMDEVLAAAFELAAGRDLVTTEAAVAAELTPVGQLMAFFASYSRTDQDWSFQLWLDAWSEAARQPAVGATSRRLNVAWQQLLAEIVVRGNAAGEFRCDDPEAAAWRIVSMIDGLALQAVVHGNVISRDDVMRWSLAATERELDLPPGSLVVPATASPRRRSTATRT